MAIWAGQRHLRLAWLFIRDIAVALTPRRIGNVRRHSPAFGTLDAPVPLSDDDLHLFGRHLDHPSLRRPHDHNVPACVKVS